MKAYCYVDTDGTYKGRVYFDDSCDGIRKANALAQYEANRTGQVTRRVGLDGTSPIFYPEFNKEKAK